ncbi:bifunctional 3'-5' exonuclease/ATP-dependent helicase WRN-like [Hydractinia symbiolongicarpus]|uniref:bifunctional 3'-5' exonuclease/ATP-dependent helicase WRN-like n=1 Tax=Hydractinia symbiolongicarpus TaxID=13093 RepID=UPI00254BD1CA|nr:bifunctional 3'-5' exonuclease/ATP-dependent helicase WRN-like [Hydractinia symbiolongicarpus]
MYLTAHDVASLPYLIVMATGNKKFIRRIAKKLSEDTTSLKNEMDFLRSTILTIKEESISLKKQMEEQKDELISLKETIRQAIRSPIFSEIIYIISTGILFNSAKNDKCQINNNEKHEEEITSLKKQCANKENEPQLTWDLFKKSVEENKEMGGYACRENFQLWRAAGGECRSGRSQNPPLCLELNIAPSPLVLVVSPLISLIQDQVSSANSLSALGLKASKLDCDDYGDIISGNFNILIGTPESWLNNARGASPMSNEDKPFREAFGRISEMRSICRQDLPILALSATVDVDLTQLVIRSCGLSKKLRVISVCSDRQNIRLCVLNISSRENVQCLKWIVDTFLSEVSDTHKVIIYCRSATLCGFVYYHVRKMIERETLGNGMKSTDLIALFHSGTLEAQKSNVLSALTSDTGTIRLVVATSSLGCGVNMKNVKFVVHYGPAYDTADYCQQVGRAGRNIEGLCHAVLYVFPQGRGNVNNSMVSYIQSHEKSRQDTCLSFLLSRCPAFLTLLFLAHEKSCFRTSLYTPFNEDGNSVMPLSPGHNCCSFCARKCECDECPLFPFEIVTEEKESKLFGKKIIREVSEDDKQLVKDMLVEYHETICSKPMLLVPGEVMTGLSKSCINEIVLHLPYINSMEYIQNNLNLGTDTSKELMLILNDVFHDIEVPDVHKECDDSMEIVDKTNLECPEFSDFSEHESNDSEPDY